MQEELKEAQARRHAERLAKLAEQIAEYPELVKNALVKLKPSTDEQTQDLEAATAHMSDIDLAQLVHQVNLDIFAKAQANKKTEKSN